MSERSSSAVAARPRWLRLVPGAAAERAVWPYLSLLGLGAAFTFVHSAYVAVLPLHLLNLGYGTSTVGFVVSALMVGTILFRAAVAHVVDSWPQRLLLALGVVGVIAGGLGLLAIPAGLGWAVPRLVHGMAMSALFTTAFAWLGRNSTNADRGVRFGGFSFTTAVTLTVAPAAGFWIYGHMGMGGLVAACTAIMLGAGIGLVGFRTIDAGGPVAPVTAPAATGEPMARHKPDGPVMLIVGVMTATASVLGIAQAFMPFVAVGKGFHDLGPLYVLYGAGLAAGRLIGGRLSDRLGRKPVAVGSSLLLTVAAAGLDLLGGVGFVVTMFLLGAALGSTNSALLTWLADVAAGPRQGRILGLSMIVPDVAASALVAFGGVYAQGRALDIWGVAVVVSLVAFLCSALAPRTQIP